jgi:hypothetical protein
LGDYRVEVSYDERFDGGITWKRKEKKKIQ